MRKNNGFTLIELLAVMIILALLIVLVVPSYTSIYSTIKRQNFQSKLTELNTAAQKYGSKIKDEIKDAPGSCKVVTIEDLIKDGLIISEEDSRNVIYDPTTNEPLEGVIDICYCKSSFDIESFYAVPYEEGEVYYKGDYVRYNNKTYKCMMDTFVSGSKPAGVKDKDKKGNSYFQALEC